MIQTMAWMGQPPTSVGMFRRRYAKWIGEENAWSYRAPMTLLPGEVPTDVLARLHQLAANFGGFVMVAAESVAATHCYMVGPPGLEPGTVGLKVRCSTN
jgi:hypothetical protein